MEGAALELGRLAAVNERPDSRTTRGRRRRIASGPVTDKEDGMPQTTREMKAKLADIDNHIERIAVAQPAGSDLNEVAYAIHYLIEVVESIIDTTGANA
jgi:hypothetical protein